MRQILLIYTVIMIIATMAATPMAVAQSATHSKRSEIKKTQRKRLKKSQNLKRTEKDKQRKRKNAAQKITSFLGGNKGKGVQEPPRPSPAKRKDFQRLRTHKEIKHKYKNIHNYIGIRKTLGTNLKDPHRQNLQQIKPQKMWLAESKLGKIQILKNTAVLKSVLYHKFYTILSRKKKLKNFHKFVGSQEVRIKSPSVTRPKQLSLSKALWVSPKRRPILENIFLFRGNKRVRIEASHKKDSSASYFLYSHLFNTWYAFFPRSLVPSAGKKEFKKPDYDYDEREIWYE
ncbi:MAG: hypothetical protein OXB93_05420 [Cytophagales bacterium]|nr:hypothetical protein [Cytophagales bacterium]